MQKANENATQRVAVFSSHFLEDLTFFVQHERRLALKLLELVEAILRDPSQGLGKPEPLKHMPANTWSRRLNQEHRVVYTVAADRITFLQARYHY